jgi:hypothetical protein
MVAPEGRGHPTDDHIQIASVADEEFAKWRNQVIWSRHHDCKLFLSLASISDKLRRCLQGFVRG